MATVDLYRSKNDEYAIVVSNDPEVTIYTVFTSAATAYRDQDYWESLGVETCLGWIYDLPYGYESNSPRVP